VTHERTVLERLEELRPVLDAHAGGIELIEVRGSTVRLRFTGMCTGCNLRPLTTVSTIRPALLELTGVDTVEIEGSRISAEAEARLAAAFAAAAEGCSRGHSGAAARPVVGPELGHDLDGEADHVPAAEPS
jgi:Fe-S cluster biogenesis protein NfuA